LPTYAMAGWLAPFLLVILRMAQGFALGGEWSGAALVATENAPEGKRAIFGTFPQLGASLGFILANVLFLLIAAMLPSDDLSRPSHAFLSWGWRIPFLFSAVMVVVGLWVRLKLAESRAFRQVMTQSAVQKMPLRSVMQKHGRALVLGTFYMLATYVLFYLITTFSLSYGRAARDAATPGLGFGYNTFVWLMVLGAVFFGLATLASGPWAEQLGRRTFLIWITIGIAAYGISWVPLLAFGTWGAVAWLVTGFVLMGLSFGPMGALLPELFPANVRYTGSGIAYNASSIIGAAVAPFIAVALWQYGEGSPFWVGMYLTTMAILTLTALLAGSETMDTDFDA